MSEGRILSCDIFPQRPYTTGTDLCITVWCMVLVAVDRALCTASVSDENIIIFCKKDALLHISEIDYKRFETMEETGLKEGDEIDVKLIGVHPKTNKLKLSRKALLPKPEGYVERERRPRPERGERGERRDRGERRERHEHKED